MQRDIDYLENVKKEYMDIWWSTPAETPAFDGIYSPAVQVEGEREMDDIVDCLVSEIRSFNLGNGAGRREWGIRVRDLMRRAGKCVISLTDSDMDLLLERGFIGSTSEFINRAREFNPSLGLDDIMQAIRNVWVMNCIQLLLGLEVRHTPSVFAYSMLYPYTDNYLDEPGVKFNEKRNTGEKFRAMLEGRTTNAGNRYESGLLELVRMIESQYPRSSCRQVYSSLLSIHDAQQRSLLQQKGSLSPYEINIFDISFEKGGTSVLADAFLAKGDLTEAEVLFMYGFGIILQLADDLQDAVRDMKSGHMTLFSQTAGKWLLDNITNRLLNFSGDILGRGGIFSAPDANVLLKVMKKSCTFLILSAVANNSRLYGKNYIDKVEMHSPFSFRYVRKLNKRIDSEYKKLNWDFLSGIL